MALKIQRQQSLIRRFSAIGAGILGIGAALGVPLSYALPAHSPAHTNSHLTSSQTMKSQAVSNTSSPSTQSSPPMASMQTNCTIPAHMHTGLMATSSSHLKKLAQYEQVCQSAIISKVSFFVPTPTTDQEAQSNAADVAARLREFSSFGISPLVFFEPTNTSGLVSMADYRSGKYDSALNTYFAAIKAAGVTDTMMGTWVPFPEANIPVWTSVNPDDFAACVTKAITYQKKYFPASTASIMLDTLSYPSATSWSGGTAISFLPYVKNIPAGMVDSMGLQGFPWSPPTNEGGPTNGTPQEYLRTDLAAEAARALHASSIWLNTGTFGTKYAAQPAQKVTISPEQRHAYLSEVVTQAKSLQTQGFSVAVHLFAQDKTRVPEGTDWSYWPTGAASSSPSTEVFKAFAHNLQAVNVPLWLFDTDEL